MKTVVAFPGTGVFAQQVARAFLEHNCLECFATTFAYTDDAVLAKFIEGLPSKLGRSLKKSLSHRCISEIDSQFISTRPILEIFRTIASKATLSTPMVDRIWDLMAHDFTRHVARQFVPKCKAIYAYEYTALEVFERAHNEGVACILDLPSLSSRQFELIQQEERAKFPDLSSPYDGYFEGKFAIRQERREKEIELADIIMTNSSLTAKSYIKFGADPSLVFTLPLAAPPTIMEIGGSRSDTGTPLEIIWAGSFIIRKGAHYFMESWRKFNSGRQALAHVYGSIGIPERMLRPTLHGLIFHGPKSQVELFAAMERADVLIFPSLSDGFGMVVAEALSRGLPVITTDQAGAADLIEHNVNGLIIPAGDANAISDALQWCQDNRQYLYEMRYAALKKAKEWQWHDYRKRLIEILSVGLVKAGFKPEFKNS